MSEGLVRDPSLFSRLEELSLFSLLDELSPLSLLLLEEPSLFSFRDDFEDLWLLRLLSITPVKDHRRSPVLSLVFGYLGYYSELSNASKI